MWSETKEVELYQHFIQSLLIQGYHPENDVEEYAHTLVDLTKAVMEYYE